LSGQGSSSPSADGPPQHAGIFAHQQVPPTSIKPVLMVDYCVEQVAACATWAQRL